MTNYPHSIMTKRNYILYFLVFIDLLIANTVSAQKLSVNLDVTQYPKLVYHSKKIDMNRDLFSTQKNELNLTRVNSGEASFLLSRSESPSNPLCQQWSKTLVYLGMFSSAGKDAAMIRDTHFKTIKVKVGELIADKQLTLQTITNSNFTATSVDSSICLFKKLSY